MAEFTNAQINRIDEIYNASYEFCKVMTELDDDLPWDMQFIGEIADLAQETLNHCGYKVRFPAIVEDDDGNEIVVDY